MSQLSCLSLPPRFRQNSRGWDMKWKSQFWVRLCVRENRNVRCDAEKFEKKMHFSGFLVNDFSCLSTLRAETWNRLRHEIRFYDLMLSFMVLRVARTVPTRKKCVCVCVCVCDCVYAYMNFSEKRRSRNNIYNRNKCTRWFQQFPSAESLEPCKAGWFGISETEIAKPQTGPLMVLSFDGFELSQLETRFLGFRV